MKKTIKTEADFQEYATEVLHDLAREFYRLGIVVKEEISVTVSDDRYVVTLTVRPISRMPDLRTFVPMTPTDKAISRSLTPETQTPKQLAKRGKVLCNSHFYARLRHLLDLGVAQRKSNGYVQGERWKPLAV